MSTRSTPSSSVEPSPFITAQFHRAVQVIQSLPKSGPIQSSYEEKLAMYSLFKQVTMGNVQGARPSMFDPLKRSKWDAWKSKDSLSKEQAMRAYVGTLIQVLKRYKDRREARALIREFEMSGSFNAGSGRPAGRGVADSGVSGWTGVEGSQTAGGYPPTSSSRRSSTSSSSSSGSGSSTGSSEDAQHRPATAPAQRQHPPVTTQHLPDPSLPPPDVSPRRMNPALPRTGASEDGHARRRQQPPAGPTPSASTPISPCEAPSPTLGAVIDAGRQQFMPSPLRQQPATAPVASAFPGPSTTAAASSSTLLPHSSLPPRVATSSPPLDDQAPIHLALQKIQTSLSALHSRLTVLESTTTQLAHTSHPLLTLLFPPSGRAVTVRRLVWEVIKRVLADAVLLAFGVSVWVMVTRGAGVGGALGRRKEVVEFWKAMGRLVGRRRRATGGP